MNAEETKALEEAWELHCKILMDIRKLADCNVSLAYGAIRTAETMVDIIFTRRVRQADTKEGK